MIWKDNFRWIDSYAAHVLSPYANCQYSTALLFIPSDCKRVGVGSVALPKCQPLAKRYIWLLVSAADVKWAAFPFSDLLKDSKSSSRKEWRSAKLTDFLKVLLFGTIPTSWGFFSTKNLSRKNNPLNIYLLYKKIQGAEDIQIKQKRRELSVAARRACADRIKRNADQHEGTHRTEIPQNHKPIWNLSVFSYKYPAYSLPFEALKHVMGYPISGGTF